MRQCFKGFTGLEILTGTFDVSALGSNGIDEGKMTFEMEGNIPSFIKIYLLTIWLYVRASGSNTRTYTYTHSHTHIDTQTHKHSFLPLSLFTSLKYSLHTAARITLMKSKSDEEQS